MRGNVSQAEFFNSSGNYGIYSELPAEWKLLPSTPAGLKHLTVVRFWPHYFTVACLAAVSAPIVASVRLAEDPSVRYWVGIHGYFLSLLPVYILVCHIVNMRLGSPKMIPVIFSTIVPCIVMILCSNFHFSATGTVATMLMSSDCTTFAMKQDLHRAWEKAVSLYDTCVHRIAHEQGLTYSDTLKIYRLHECEEFQHVGGTDTDLWAEYRSRWDYLRSLEEDVSCCGWCWQSRPLWSFSEVRDSCSMAAGALLKSKVEPIASNILLVAMLGLIFSIAGIVWGSYQVRLQALEWARV